MTRTRALLRSGGSGFHRREIPPEPCVWKPSPPVAPFRRLRRMPDDDRLTGTPVRDAPQRHLMRSQHGEDLALYSRFPKSSGFYVEVGALDGVELSNTHYFEHALNWRGVLVEANPLKAEECRINRPQSTVAAVAVTSPDQANGTLPFSVAVGFEALSTLNLTSWAKEILDRAASEREISIQNIDVPTRTLDSVLSEAGCPPDFDFMTIDIEGYEVPALRGFSLGTLWRPQVFIIENGSGFLPWFISAYLFRAGYGYVRSIGHNDWFEPMPTRARCLSQVANLRANGVYGMRTQIKKLLKRAHLYARVKKIREKSQGTPK
jgi:FkbM family methyltransferase